jgi:hypothetical protein
MKKYGIKVPMMSKDDWVWVTTGIPDPATLELEILTFDTIQDAQKVADSFGPLAMVSEFVGNKVIT